MHKPRNARERELVFLGVSDENSAGGLFGTIAETEGDELAVDLKLCEFKDCTPSYVAGGAGAIKYSSLSRKDCFNLVENFGATSLSTPTGKMPNIIDISNSGDNVEVPPANSREKRDRAVKQTPTTSPDNAKTPAPKPGADMPPKPASPATNSSSAKKNLPPPSQQQPPKKKKPAKGQNDANISLLGESKPDVDLGGTAGNKIDLSSLRLEDLQSNPALLNTVLDPFPFHAYYSC